MMTAEMQARHYEEDRTMFLSLVALAWCAVFAMSAVWLVSTYVTNARTVECIHFAPPGLAPPPGSCKKLSGGGG